MYSRSLSERIKIRLEILYENFLDFLSHNALRKPVLIFVGLALFVTLRNSKHVISKLKHSTYISPFNSRYGSSSNYMSTYGSAASSLYDGGNAPSSQYGNRMTSTSTMGGYGGNPSPSYGGASMYGGATSNGATQYNANLPSSTYGIGGGTTSYQQQQPFGQSTNLRGSQTSTNSFSTSLLVDQYSGSVQVAQGGLFQDYGGLTSFTGQVETLSAMESPTSVQQTLSSPGSGKVLVVDGSGSYNGAVFDASMANIALSNGWKGVIINGVVRNAEQLKSIQFGVKAIGAHPSPGQQQIPGQRGISLSFGGVNFVPGNYVYADKEGIVVSATNVGGGVGMPSQNGGLASTTYGAGLQSTGVGGSTYSTGQTNNYSSQGSTYSRTGQMNSYSTPQTNSFSSPQRGMYPSGNSLSTGMGATGSNYGATSSYGGGFPSSYSNTNRSSPFSRGSSYSSSSSYGRQKKKPSKKTLLGLLFLVCVLGWICMSD